MNKKKLVSLCLVLALVLTAVIGGTMAYYTDTDEAENVFTTGNVDITLEEIFDEDNAKLMPGKENAVTKEVYVINEGSENAFVRVHIAYPSILDSGSEDQPQFAAYNNTLHWNFPGDSVQKGQWSQLNTEYKDKTGSNAKFPNWPGDYGYMYNFYQTEIEGISYNVYVYTYETALTEGEKTETPAINQVYLDKTVTNEMMKNEEQTGILDVLGEIQVLVFAEGGQEAGFEDDAFAALNEQFGDPMAEGYVDPWHR